MAVLLTSRTLLQNWRALLQVEAMAFGQYVKLHVIERQALAFRYVRQVGECDSARVHDRHGPFAHDAKLAAFDNHRRVLVYAKAQVLRIMGDCGQEPSDATALREMSINHR